MMAAIRGIDTRPEMLVRRGLHAIGWRYRLHVKSLPGKPDMVFPARKAVVQVHGCFWHGHDCRLFRLPKTRQEFWREKIGSNVDRDTAVRGRLRDLGWRVLDVWECKLKGPERLPLDAVLAECDRFLRGDEPFASIGRDQTVSVVDLA